ncbi:MAG TPA: hypothetical protein VID69_09895 [Actinomycetota bacterium]
MPHHLQPVPADPSEPAEPFGVPDEGFLGPTDAEEGARLVRPAWWRWVAIAVILALVVAGPFAFVLYLLLT